MTTVDSLVVTTQADDDNWVSEAELEPWERKKAGPLKFTPPHVRVAESLLELRDQVDAAAPDRSKASDGTLGDAAHRARRSDHNPDVIDGEYGIVTAMDVTHDPAHGLDAGLLTEAIRESRDERVKYLIFNGRICNFQSINGADAWAWRPYGGSNPHTAHMHISVRATKDKYDSTAPWRI